MKFEIIRDGVDKIGVVALVRVCSPDAVNKTDDVTLVRNHRVVDVFPNVKVARQRAAELIERLENAK